MKKLILIVLLASCTLLKAQTPAFPGAEGGGMYTTGGRGGVVYYVNTLEDNNTGSAISKEGSLRWCLGRTGKRTILFKVSGTIRLNSQLSIKSGDVTVAGQSAPGDGICVADYPVQVSADNVILRYMRFRMGDEKISVGEADGADALGGRGFKNVIVDHCSVSWCTDECSSFYDCNNFTMQWCIVSESLRLSKHDKGPHGYGGIWGGTNSTFHHNLLAHHDSRNPRLGPGQNKPPHTETVDMRNNVIYNWVGNSCYGAEAMNANLINNYYKPGPSTPTGTSRGKIISIDKDQNEGSIRYNVWGQFYIDGNVIDGTNVNAVNTTKDNWTYGVYNQYHSSYGTVSAADKAAMKMADPFAITGLWDGEQISTEITTHTAEKGYQKVLDFAGAGLSRDSYDARIVDETRTGKAAFKGLSVYNGYSNNYPGSSVDWKSKAYPKAGIIDSQSDLKPSGAGSDWSAWPTLVQSVVPEDSDKDGIPDGWLDANGYTGKKATEYNEDGYTYLEVYLNSLVKDITDAQNTDAITSIESDKFIEEVAELNVSYDKASDSIFVEANSIIKTLEVYNLTGVLVGSVSCNDTYSIVDLKNDLSRFYIVKATLNSGSVSTVKFIK